MSGSSSRPSIVYQATNLVNGKRYVGVTTQTLASRVSKHKSEASKPISTCRLFHRGIRKYGFYSFRFRTLVVVPTIADAHEIERKAIAIWKPEYNITAGGEGTLGHIVSPEARAKIGAARVGKAAPNRGIPHTAATRAKIAAKATGRKWTDEQRQARSEQMRLSGTHNSKPVRCLTDGKWFRSASDADRHYGYPITSVAGVIVKWEGRIKGRVFAYEVTL